MTLVYTYDIDGDFKTITRNQQYNSYSILPSFGINISRGYDKDRVYISSNQYYAFASLLEKTVKMVSEHLYEIFPNVGRVEFDIDTKTLERYQTEKAMACDGITMSPAVFVDDTNQCFPGITINTVKTGSLCMPLQDAITISKLLNGLNPHMVSLSLLSMFGNKPE